MVFLLLCLFSFPPDGYQGIHEVEWKKHQGVIHQEHSPETAIPLQKGARELRKTVYGYYPYWMGTAYNDLQYDLLSVIAYFSVELYDDGSLGTIPNLSILQNLRNTAHSHGVRVVITATQFDDTSIENLLSSPSARTTAVVNLLGLASTHVLDGVSIDFEFPPNAVKDSLTNFMAELADSFYANIPDAHVTIATPAVDWGNGFDYDQLALHTDGLFIMAYNYYWAGSPYAGPVSPLPSSSLWGTYSVMWTVNDYIQYGLYRDKFIVGCPYYGLRWPTQNDGLRSPTRGTGSALTYSRAADSADIYLKLWEDTSKTVWYKNYISGDGWYQCWFDDSLSLRLTYAVVIDSNLGGAGIWALGYDGTRPELWGALRDAFYFTGIDEQSAKEGEFLAFPNPARDRVHLHCRWLNTDGEVSLNIFDLTGRNIKKFPLPTSCPIPITIIWNGKDKRGKPVPSGMYFFVFSTESWTSSRKILLMR